MKVDIHFRANATYESHKNYNNSKITHEYILFVLLNRVWQFLCVLLWNIIWNTDLGLAPTDIPAINKLLKTSQSFEDHIDPWGIFLAFTLPVFPHILNYLHLYVDNKNKPLFDSI